MNKKIILAAIALTLAGAGLALHTRVYAQSAPSSVNSLVQKIAQRFGLKASDVQTVFDSHRAERQQEMQAAYEAQLSQFVKGGKITEAQKQLILAKHKEMQADRQSHMEKMSSLTETERSAAMESHRTEMEAKHKELQDWAAANGIDIRYVMGFGFKGDHTIRGDMHGF